VSVLAVFALVAALATGGIALQTSSGSSWLGWAVLFAPMTVLLSLAVIAKWFGTYAWTYDMTVMTVLAFGLFTAGTAGVWAGEFGANISDPSTIWFLSTYVLYPAVLLLGTSLYAWADNQWTMPTLSVYGLPSATLLVAVWCLVVASYSDLYVGAALGVILVFSAYAGWLVSVWAYYNFYLPEAYSAWLELILIVGGCLAIVFALAFDQDLFFALSVGFVMLSARSGGRAIATVVAHGAKAGNPKDAPILLGPMVLPAFAFNPVTGDAMSMNGAVLDGLSSALTALLWGIFATMFVDSIEPGIAIVCVIVGGITVGLAFAASDTELKLGEVASYADDRLLNSAASAVREVFYRRRRPVQPEAPELQARDEKVLQDELEQAERRGGAAVREATKAIKEAKRRQQEREDAWKERASAGELAAALRRRQWETVNCFPWEPEASKPGIGGIEAIRCGASRGL